MPSEPPDAHALADLRAELEALDGVERAWVEGPPHAVWVLGSADHAGPAEMLVRSVLARRGLVADEVDVHLLHRSRPEPRRRVRFLATRMLRPRVGRAAAEVELEWNGRRWAERMEGESGPAVELRLAALATLRSLDAILGGRLTFQLVGIKSFRAFDADVVVAVVRVAELGGGDLIGASLAHADANRSAALAVLNATNRVLGNYLTTAEG